MTKQKWISILSIAGLVLCCSITVADTAFTSLFNGNDLSGWNVVGTVDAFAVKNESIFSTGASPYPSWLCTDKQYENFILRFEYQTEGWYEGGIFIHAPEDGPSSKLGLKLHLRHDQHEYGVRSPGALYDAAAPLALANKPSGQWNQCEIVCDWPTLRVTLNGTLIHDLDMGANEAFRYRLRRGYIGIQNLGCKAYFRHIEIQPLPDQEEWTNLFAQGMEGLELVEDTTWTLEGDVLTGKFKNGFAFTKSEFEGSFEFQVWVKTQVNGNGGAHFYGSGNNHGVEVQCFNCPDSTNPTGSFYGIAPANRVVSADEEWFLMQIFANGPHAMVLVNGEKVSETQSLKPPYRGCFGFQQHTPGATIQYRGARVKKTDW